MDYINGRLTGIVSVNELEKEINEVKNTKQDTLVSGINIKTVNGMDITGRGNVDLFKVVDKTTHIELTVGGVTYKLAKYTEGQ